MADRGGLVRCHCDHDVHCRPGAPYWQVDQQRGSDRLPDHGCTAHRNASSKPLAWDTQGISSAATGRATPHHFQPQRLQQDDVWSAYRIRIHCRLRRRMPQSGAAPAAIGMDHGADDCAHLHSGHERDSGVRAPFRGGRGRSRGAGIESRRTAIRDAPAGHSGGGAFPVHLLPRNFLRIFQRQHAVAHGGRLGSPSARMVFALASSVQDSV